MRLTALAIFALGALVGASGIAVRDAYADRTVTYLSTPSIVDSMCFHFPDAGNVNVTAVVCGHTTDSLGAVQDTSCTPGRLLPAGALRTNIFTLRTGAARTEWMTINGL